MEISSGINKNNAFPVAVKSLLFCLVDRRIARHQVVLVGICRQCQQQPNTSQKVSIIRLYIVIVVK